jgi:hypothetical protein
MPNAKSLLGTRGLLMVVIILSAAVCALGQGSAASGGRITPDRIQREPAGRGFKAMSTDECDPDTVRGTCPWSYAFTYGFNAGAPPRHGGNQTEKAGFAFATYLTKRLSVEFDNDNVVSIKPPSADRFSGFGDTTIYVGYDAILEENGHSHPALSFTYGLKAPTANSVKGVGSGEVDHSLDVTIMKTSGQNYFQVDAGDYFAGRAKASGFDQQAFLSGFLLRTLDQNGKYKLHLEVGGDFATSKSNADMYSLDYLERRFTKKDAKTYVALRLGARIGLTPNVSRAGFYIALRVKGNLKNVFK